MKTIKTTSGHTMAIEKTTGSIFSSLDLEDFDKENYTSYYRVRNWNKTGVVFFYLARYRNGEWHVWYRYTSKMWISRGHTIEAAINGAQRDGWMYA